jgi:hypothetical protein
MCQLCNWDDKSPNEKKELINLTYIRCYGCQMLSEISPELVNLRGLYCFICPLISSIPSELVNLRQLNCSNCPLITNIPSELVNLRQLNCSSCPLITKLPSELVNLVYLNCGSCPLITSIPQGIDLVYCSKCTWLDHPHNKDFKSNMEKLTLIQRNMKPLIKYKRLKRIVYSEQFARLWYHPNAGGGRRAKRRMLELFTPRTVNLCLGASTDPTMPPTVAV